MAKRQITLTSLGLVAVTPPEKRMVSENDGHSSSSSCTGLNSSSSSNSISNKKSFSDNIDTDLLSWKTKWENYADDYLRKRPQDPFAIANELFFPNIHTLLIITCTIPVTT